MSAYSIASVILQYPLLFTSIWSSTK